MEKKTDVGGREREWTRKVADGLLSRLVSISGYEAGPALGELRTFCSKDIAPIVGGWHRVTPPGSTRWLTLRQCMPEVTIHKETMSPVEDEALYEGTFGGPIHSASFELRVRREDGGRCRVGSFETKYRDIGLSATPSIGKEGDVGAVEALQPKLDKLTAHDHLGAVVLALGSHGDAAKKSLPKLMEWLDKLVEAARREALAVSLGKIGGDEALKHLKILADADTEPNVRRAATAALKRLLAAKKDKM